MISIEVKSTDNHQSEMNKLKRELRRKVSMANKRLDRLERNNLTELPAYRQWRDYKGGVRFSSAGSDYNELQSELARVDRFINARTSLVRQANSYLKELASITSLKYQKVSDLPDLLNNFFEISSKIEQYLRQVEDSASAIGYQKIWDTVNQYVSEQGADLSDVNGVVASMIEELGYLKMYEEVDDMWSEINI